MTKLDTLTYEDFCEELEALRERHSEPSPVHVDLRRMTEGGRLWNLLVRMEHGTDVERIAAERLLTSDELAAVATSAVFSFRQQCATPPWGDYDAWSTIGAAR